MSNQGKIDKMDFTKIKIFCVPKDFIKKVTIPPIKWEKIYTNHISDKGLLVRIKNSYN